MCVYYSGRVELRRNFETNRLEFKEKVTEYFEDCHDELFQSQVLLQLFKLEIKKSFSSGFNFFF